MKHAKHLCKECLCILLDVDRLGRVKRCDNPKCSLQDVPVRTWVTQ